jgi:hypothetical protein
LYLGLFAVYSATDEANNVNPAAPIYSFGDVIIPVNGERMDAITYQAKYLTFTGSGSTNTTCWSATFCDKGR